MNKPLALPLLILSLFWTGLAHSQSGDPGVVVQTVVQEPIRNRIEALGTLRGNESIRLTSNVTKTVTRLNFEDGERVEKGRVLVEMTSAEEIALLEEARTNAEDAERQWRRVRSLVEQGAASQSMLDERQREYHSAQARYNALQARLEDLRLRAPFDGVVGLRNISVGALVTPGDLITTLVDDHQMKLDFTLPAVHLQAVEPGLEIRARSRALGNQLFEGRVSSIDNQVDPVTRSFTVRAVLPNDDGLLKPGLLMTVELLTREREAVMVSEAAVMSEGGIHYVFVINNPDSEPVAEQRTVEIGERFVGWVEILEGLSAGEKVVTHGLQKVRPDQPVVIAAEDAGSDPLPELLNQSR